MRQQIIFLGVFLCLAQTIPAQRHLPDLQIFESTETVFLDVIAETPAVNNGMAATTTPRLGEDTTIQIFIPRAAGLAIFECSLEIDNPNGALTSTFRIVSVQDWLQRDLRPLSSKDFPTYYSARLMPVLLPYSGHVATVVLSPLKDLRNPLPLKITCSVTSTSIPPRRVWQMRGTQQVTWY